VGQLLLKEITGHGSWSGVIYPSSPAIRTDTLRAAQCAASPAALFTLFGFVFVDTFAAAFAFELVAGRPVFICHR
jgi:hypothetical protein